MQLACMFPGQGSQSLGMLKGIYEADSIIAETFAVAKDVLNIDFWSMIESGTEIELNDTINTQVVMLLADVAMYRFLVKHGMPKPSMMAGHSLGEYAALVCAEAIELSDAIRLVRKRAELMRDAVENNPGAMAAIIGLEDQVVEDICLQLSNAQSGMSLEPANYNAPGQLVIAGHRELIERSISQFEEAGARMTKVLPVSVPCHCRLMLPAAEQFFEELKKINFSIPKIQLISNVDLSIYDSIDTMRKLLAQQLYQPVRWTQTIRAFEQHGIEKIVECGPGKVLCGLAKRIAPDLKSIFCFEINHLPNWDIA
jgi:[acyl-carrier-protein] S-malonyltransferase